MKSAHHITTQFVWVVPRRAWHVQCSCGWSVDEPDKTRADNAPWLHEMRERQRVRDLQDAIDGGAGMSANSCTCPDCAAGKIQSVAGPGCSLPEHEFTEVNGTRCWNCGTDFRTQEQIEEDAAAKAVVIREGSALRTSEELCDVFVDDVCELLAIERPPADEFCPHNTDDEGEGCPPDCTQTNGAFASELADDYERKLPDDYTVAWNDGYVIYRGLDAVESEAVNG